MPNALEPPANPNRGGWFTSLALGLIRLAAYLANNRLLLVYDTIPAELLPHALLRGDGPVLDRFQPVIHAPGRSLPDYVEYRRGHLVSRYPIATSLISLPLIAVQRLAWGLIRPGWDANPLSESDWAGPMAKHAASAWMALAVVLLHRLLRPLGSPSDAVIATLAAGLGSPYWTIGSQALWQHGPAALLLTAALLVLATPRPGPLRFAFAGLLAGVLVAVRLSDAVFAGLLLSWVIVRHPRGLFAFLPGFLLITAALLTYNVTWFGTPFGGQAALEALHPRRHAVAGPWSADLLGGFLGTFFSPSRGLFVFVPWSALALSLAPWSAHRLDAHPRLGWMSLGLLPFTVLLSVYAVWWGGFCYGPRYWTDAVPCSPSCGSAR